MTEHIQQDTAENMPKYGLSLICIFSRMQNRIHWMLTMDAN